MSLRVVLCMLHLVLTPFWPLFPVLLSRCFVSSGLHKLYAQGLCGELIDSMNSINSSSPEWCWKASYYTYKISEERTKLRSGRHKGTLAKWLLV